MNDIKLWGKKRIKDYNNELPSYFQSLNTLFSDFCLLIVIVIINTLGCLLTRFQIY